MSRELHPTRLGTTDDGGHRIAPQPEEVSGKWKNRRHMLFAILIGFYLFLPWVVVDGKQWVMLDILKREFTIFGQVFYGHDASLLIFIFLGFLFLAGFVTTVWGRAWCGWACPQTVFIEGVYRRIEAFVEGNARKRKALEKAPLSAQKIAKRSIKWFLYLIVSLHIVHSFLGYFVGTYELLEISFQSPAKNWGLFVTMSALTGIVLFDFGWFREQFCVIACPYGRFQSVMMDESSLVVAYDYNRGEPRREKGLPLEQEGDCIDCFKCVKVCPTGIDIRRGTQMECIHCTLCIDACDEIMRKVDRPEGLIRYSSEKELESQKKHKWSARAWVYLALALSMLIGLFSAVTHRTQLDVQFLRMPGEPFTKVGKSGSLYINRYELRLETVARNGKLLKVDMANSVDPSLVQLISGQLPLTIKADKETASLFIQFDKEILNQGRFDLPILIQVYSENDKLEEEVLKEIRIVGPL